MRWLARAGLVARGIMYIIIGWIAAEVAFSHSRQQADRTGALHEISATPVGGILLWLLVVGFIGMALWRLAEAAYGSPGSRPESQPEGARAGEGGDIRRHRLWGAEVRTRCGRPQSSDKQSVDLTATLMKYPGGRLLVIVIGLVIIGAGVYLAYQAWRRSSSATSTSASCVPASGASWNGWVNSAGSPGALSSSPRASSSWWPRPRLSRSRPRGSTPRCGRLASTPLGPWLLVLVAIGLIMFGVFSCCEAKWMRL